MLEVVRMCLHLQADTIILADFGTCWNQTSSVEVGSGNIVDPLLASSSQVWTNQKQLDSRVEEHRQWVASQ